MMMKSFNTIQRLVYGILTILMVASCAHTEVYDTQLNCNASSKIINSDDNAVRGTLMVKLTKYMAECSFGDVDGFSINTAPLFPAGKATVTELNDKEIYRWLLLTFDDGANLESIANAIAKDDRVSIVEYNEYMEHVNRKTECNDNMAPMSRTMPTRSCISPKCVPFDDPYLYDQWHYDNDGNSYYDPNNPTPLSDYAAGADINLFSAWEYCAGDPRIIIAVIDGGIMTTHPDLMDNLWTNEAELNGVAGVDDDGNGYIDDIHGYNFLNNSAIIDSDDHGTHVAGTIAAVNNNGYGVCGIAGGTGNNDGCRIMSCEINAANGFASSNNIAAAIKYAADNGAILMNNSWTSGSSFTTDNAYYKSYGVIIDAISYFENNAKYEGLIDGGIAIFAAGNENNHIPFYPGAYYNNICVTAFSPDFTAAPYTNYGPGANICAPGGSKRGWEYSIISTDASEWLFGSNSGTSMAAPHVTGCAALGLSYALKLGKSFTREEFKSIILTSVHNIDQYQTSRKPDDMVSIGGSSGEMENIEHLKGQLGSGYIDAHLLLMQVEGTPCLYLTAGKDEQLSLDNIFGGGSEGLTYDGCEIDNNVITSLGISVLPTFVDGKLKIKCNNSGVGRITIRAIIGGPSVGGGDNMGGMLIEREFELVVRRNIASNGGWL